MALFGYSMCVDKFRYIFSLERKAFQISLTFYSTIFYFWKVIGTSLGVNQEIGKFNIDWAVKFDKLLKLPYVTLSTHNRCLDFRDF